jgi:hypothetical protein
MVGEAVSSLRLNLKILLGVLLGRHAKVVLLENVLVFVGD